MKLRPDVYEDYDGKDEAGKEIILERYFCPNCGNRIYWLRGNCKKCKQEIDWRGIA